RCGRGRPAQPSARTRHAVVHRPRQLDHDRGHRAQPADPLCDAAADVPARSKGDRLMRTWILLLVLALTWPGPSRGQKPGGGSAAAPARFQLENGLTAMVRPIRGATDVALLVLYKLGGDHDP